MVNLSTGFPVQNPGFVGTSGGNGNGGDMITDMSISGFFHKLSMGINEQYERGKQDPLENIDLTQIGQR